MSKTQFEEIIHCIEKKKFQMFAAVEVTPEMASIMLEYNGTNRPMKTRTVEKYTDDMVNDKWKFAGDNNIVFTDASLLRNGQHRLTAVVMSATTQTFNIVTGIDDSTFAVMDIGKNRNTGDVLAIAKYKSPTILGGAVKMIMAYEEDKLGSSKNTEKKDRNDHQDVLDWLEGKNITALEKCVDKGQVYHKRCKLFSSSTYAGFSYLFSRKSMQGADEFFEKFSTGEGISSTEFSSILVLRNKLINQQQTKGAMFDVQHKYALLIKAWNFYRAGENVKKVYWSTDEKFPKIK
jgi:hypothetical protein